MNVSCSRAQHMTMFQNEVWSPEWQHQTELSAPNAEDMFPQSQTGGNKGTLLKRQTNPITAFTVTVPCFCPTGPKMPIFSQPPLKTFCGQKIVSQSRLHPLLLSKGVLVGSGSGTVFSSPNLFPLFLPTMIALRKSSLRLRRG